MMRRKQTRFLDRETRSRVTEMLGLVTERDYEECLMVDLVLCLLRINTRQSLRSAEKLSGVKITRCPPALAMMRIPAPVRPCRRTGDDRRVLRVVSSNPRLPTTPAHGRFAVIRPGMTVASLISRGVTRRDLRVARRKRWIVLDA